MLEGPDLAHANRLIRSRGGADKQEHVNAMMTEFAETFPLGMVLPDHSGV